MSQTLPDELRQLFLKDMGITPNEGNIQQQSNEFHKAKDIFDQELHPLFFSNWGEIWITMAQLDHANNSINKNLWIVALHGVTIKQVAQAFKNYIEETGGKFPPSPMQFREYCRAIMSEQAEKSINDSKYELLN